MSSISTSPSLLNGIRSGAAESWDRFVCLYGPLVYTKCRSRGCSEADAADISQEVFLRLHKSMGQFKPDSAPKSFTRWLSTIVRNTVLDHFRRVVRDPQGGGGTAFQVMVENQPDALEESLSFAGESDRIAVLRRALAIIESDVEPQTFKAFQRHGIDGLPAPEVAEELGMTPQSVRQAKCRVMAKLKEELAGLID